MTLGRNGKTVDAPPVDFKHPFDKDALEEVSWYLEDFSYGINRVL